METVALVALLVAWIWSVARGIQVSFVCCVLNFAFPPVSQAIFAINNDKMRTPLLLMAIAFGYLVYNGDIWVETSGAI